MSRQRRKLAAGVEIVYANPGRLLKFLESGDIFLSQVEHVVFDEADSMFLDGFNEEVGIFTWMWLPLVSGRQLNFHDICVVTDATAPEHSKKAEGVTPIYLRWSVYASEVGEDFRDGYSRHRACDNEISSSKTKIFGRKFCRYRHPRQARHADSGTASGGDCCAPRAG